MAINVADVVAQFGAYYIAGSDNQKNLRNQVYKVIETAQFFQNRPTSDTIWRGTQASLSRVIQPFQKAFTPISTLTFEPNTFPLYKIKIDLQETPDDLEPTYEGFLADMDELDRSKWPFVRWWMTNHVMPKKDEDLEVNEYGKGVYVAPTPGTAGAAGTAMNGLQKVISIYNTAGRTNLGTAGDGPIVTGALSDTDADFCSQVEAFVNEIPSVFRRKLDYIFMSHTNELKYKRGRKAKYNATYRQVDDTMAIEDFEFIKVQGLESMEGLDLIWASQPDNRIRPTKKAALKDTMAVQQFAPRVVSAYTDWWEALNFEAPELVFHNEQDLL